MIENDSSLKEMDQLGQMEGALDEARQKEQESNAEMEYLKDKIKKQACTSVLKIVKLISDKAGAPGYFAHWKSIWVKGKTGVKMDDDDEDASSGSGGVMNDEAIRKISKLNKNTMNP